MTRIYIIIICFCYDKRRGSDSIGKVGGASLVLIYSGYSPDPLFPTTGDPLLPTPPLFPSYEGPILLTPAPSFGI